MTAQRLRFTTWAALRFQQWLPSYCCVWMSEPSELCQTSHQRRGQPWFQEIRLFPGSFNLKCSNSSAWLNKKKKKKKILVAHYCTSEENISRSRNESVCFCPIGTQWHNFNFSASSFWFLAADWFIAGWGFFFCCFSLSKCLEANNQRTERTSAELTLLTFKQQSRSCSHLMRLLHWNHNKYLDAAGYIHIPIRWFLSYWPITFFYNERVFSASIFSSVLGSHWLVLSSFNLSTKRT